MSADDPIELLLCRATLCSWSIIFTSDQADEAEARRALHESYCGYL